MHLPRNPNRQDLQVWNLSVDLLHGAQQSLNPVVGGLLVTSLVETGYEIVSAFPCRQDLERLVCKDDREALGAVVDPEVASDRHGEEQAYVTDDERSMGAVLPLQHCQLPQWPGQKEAFVSFPRVSSLFSKRGMSSRACRDK